MSRRRHTPIDAMPDQLIEKVQMIIDDEHYTVEEEGKIDYGYQFRFTTGTIVNIYATGKIVLQGKRDHKLNELIKQLWDERNRM